jgi:hypothetical protein
MKGTKLAQKKLREFQGYPENFEDRNKPVLKDAVEEGSRSDSRSVTSGYRGEQGKRAVNWISDVSGQNGEIPLETNGILNGIPEGIDSKEVRVRAYRSLNEKGELIKLPISKFHSEQVQVLLAATRNKKPLIINITDNRMATVKSVSPHRLIAHDADQQISLILTDHKGWGNLKEKESMARRGEGLLLTIGKDQALQCHPVIRTPVLIRKNDIQDASLRAELAEIAGNREELLFASLNNDQSAEMEQTFFAYDTKGVPIDDGDHSQAPKNITPRSELGRYVFEKYQQKHPKNITLKHIDGLPKKTQEGGFKKIYQAPYLTGLLVDKTGVISQLLDELFATGQSLQMEVNGAELGIIVPKGRQFYEGAWRKIRDLSFSLDPNQLQPRWESHGIYDLDASAQDFGGLTEDSAREALYIPIHRRTSKEFVQAWETAKAQGSRLLYDPRSGQVEVVAKEISTIQVINEHDGSSFDLKEIKAFSPGLYEKLSQNGGGVGFCLKIDATTMDISSDSADPIAVSFREMKNEATKTQQSIVFEKDLEKDAIRLRSLEPRLQIVGGTEWQPFPDTTRMIRALNHTSKNGDMLRLGQGYVDRAPNEKGPFNQDGVCRIYRNCLRVCDSIDYYLPKKIRKEVEGTFQSSIGRMQEISFSFQNDSLVVDLLTRKTRSWADEVIRELPLRKTGVVREQRLGENSVNSVASVRLDVMREESGSGRGKKPNLRELDSWRPGEWRHRR